MERKEKTAFFGKETWKRKEKIEETKREIEKNIGGSLIAYVY